MEASRELIKIAIMGPESTGKSRISKELASHYQTIWVPEFAREYCSKLNRPATLEDELEILEGQIRLESSLAPLARDILILDTMFLTVKIYSEHVFKTYPSEVDQYLISNPYDLFLLMDIDLPWEEDPLREFPQLRSYFLEIHKLEIEALGVPYFLISGVGEERMNSAINKIDGFLFRHSKNKFFSA